MTTERICDDRKNEMARERILIDQDKMYELTRDEQGRLFFTVVCGGSLMFDVTIPLTPDEGQRYAEWGTWFLDGLAHRICHNVDGVRTRAVPRE